MVDRTGKLKNSPLAYMLASVRFASWTLMAKKIDEIHEELRDILPLIHRIQVQRVGLDGQVVTQGDEATQTTMWVFMPSDRSYGIQCAPDQLLMFCKKYKRYTEFETTLSRVFDVLLKYMRFVDVTNMGVRYVDHINVRLGEKLESYIDVGWLPADIKGMEKLGGVVLGSYKSGSTELRIRSISQPGMLSVPDDLIHVLALFQEPNKVLQLEILKSGEMLLDIDSIKNNTTPERMEKDEILRQLNLLHQEANTFFRHESVCTEHAFEVWKGDI
jgi:uncharacterized protein (TIGR04255 family)